MSLNLENKKTKCLTRIKESGINFSRPPGSRKVCTKLELMMMFKLQIPPFHGSHKLESCDLLFKKT